MKLFHFYILTHLLQNCDHKIKARFPDLDVIIFLINIFIEECKYKKLFKHMRFSPQPILTR